MAGAKTYENIKTYGKSVGAFPPCCIEVLSSIKDMLEMREALNELYVAVVFYDMFGFALTGASNKGMEGINQAAQEITISEVKSEIADSYGAPDLASATVNFKRVLKYPLWQAAIAHSYQCGKKQRTQKFWRAVGAHFNPN